MGDFVMSFDVFDILLIFFAGLWLRSFFYDERETNVRYLKDGMNKEFYWSLINECLDVLMFFSCLFEVLFDRFEMGLLFFPINFLTEYIFFKYIFPFVKKLLKKGRTEDAGNI